MIKLFVMKNIWISFLLLCCGIQAQTKFEKEYRIKENQAPQKAVLFFKDLDLASKVKWYQEKSQDGISFEAKVIHNHRKYSIEFTKVGTIIDLEIQVDFKKLPKPIQNTIKNILTQRFEKFHIEKVQMQFTGDAETLKTIAFAKKSSHNQIPAYEVVCMGKHKKEWEYYELLIDKKGTILKDLKFSYFPLDNLEF